MNRVLFVSLCLAGAYASCSLSCAASPGWTRIASNQNFATNCYKDLYGGTFNYCDGSQPGSTRTDCDWVGGAGDCEFSRITVSSRQQCQDLCEADGRCTGIWMYEGTSICNMLYHTNVQATTGGATPSTLWVLAQDFCECNGERQASDALCSGDCCSPNCVNGACIGNSTTGRFCQCDQGWSGADCSTPLPPPPTPTPPPTCNLTCVSSPGWTQVATNMNFATNCYKDLYGGTFNYCDGSQPGSTRTDCNWNGGPGDCSFPRITVSSRQHCQDLCAADDRCTGIWMYEGTNICNLLYHTNVQPTSGGATPSTLWTLEQDFCTCDSVRQETDTDCAAEGQSCQPEPTPPPPTPPPPTPTPPPTCNLTCVANPGWTQIATNMNFATNCYKDLYGGTFNYCDGSQAGSTRTDCGWVGGAGDCEFPRITVSSRQHCQDLCAADDRCTGIWMYEGTNICNLLYHTNVQPTSGGATPSTLWTLEQNFCTCDRERLATDTDCMAEGLSCDPLATPVPTPSVAASTMASPPTPPNPTPPPSTSVAPTPTPPLACNLTCVTNPGWTQIATDMDFRTNCYKDLYAGSFNYCDGSQPGSTRTDCDWIGGAGDCEFPRITVSSRQNCQDLCAADDRCTGIWMYEGTSICNLMYHTNPQATSGGATPSTLWTLEQDFCTCDGARQATETDCAAEGLSCDPQATTVPTPSVPASSTRADSTLAPSPSPAGRTSGPVPGSSEPANPTATGDSMSLPATVPSPESSAEPSAQSSVDSVATSNEANATLNSTLDVAPSSEPASSGPASTSLRSVASSLQAGVPPFISQGITVSSYTFPLEGHTFGIDGQLIVEGESILQGPLTLELDSVPTGNISLALISCNPCVGQFDSLTVDMPAGACERVTGVQDVTDTTVTVRLTVDDSACTSASSLLSLSVTIASWLLC